MTTKPTLTPDLIPLSERSFWLEERAALLQRLANIERALNLPRTVAPKDDRRRFARRSSSEEGRYGHE